MTARIQGSVRRASRLSWMLIFLLAPLSLAVASPQAARRMSTEALQGHLRTKDSQVAERAVREGLTRIRDAAAKLPKREIVATIVFKDGISSDQLAKLAAKHDLDVTFTDAKVAVGESGESFSVLTVQTRERPEALAAKLRYSDASAIPTLSAAVARRQSAERREFVSAAPASTPPDLRYFAATVIGSQLNLANVASLQEVLTVTIDNDVQETVASMKAQRARSTFDSIRLSRAQEYLRSTQAEPGSTQSSRAKTAAAQNSLQAATTSSTSSGGSSPPAPAWFGNFQQETISDGDPDLNKINLFPNEHYYQCTGYGCPNNWTWVPRYNRKWHLGVVRHFGGCFWVPSFYFSSDGYDDTYDPIEIEWVQVCEEPWTEGSIFSQFRFGSNPKSAPWKPAPSMTNLSLAAYHDVLAPECHVGPTELGGVGAVEWPCDPSDVNAVYIQDSTLEDEAHIANPACTITGTRNPFNRGSYGCFYIRRAITSLPAPYIDDDLFDPGTEFHAAVGTANAAAFTYSGDYWTYIYFTSQGLNYLAGTVATHEFEIGSYFPGQWCAPGCVFKAKEYTADTLVFVPVLPAALSISNLTGGTAKANWNNGNDVAGLAGFEWRLNGGAWNAAAASPVTMTGLASNTSYTFEVRAIDPAGTRGPAASSSFTTPGLVPITNSSGQILPSAAGLYVVGNSCSGGTWHTACTWVVRKIYGDFGQAATVTDAPAGVTPGCGKGTYKQVSAGYVLSGCSLSAQWSTYGQ